ncbi:6-pyruvoyl-tetrahydropterin synthase [Candidatus Nitrososphaera evergladensis SR1]|uniref:6-pyruvoyl-tetrahydropterin synthase n=1 Tax=Candidatus Nitrososphaera evergladensis SR1 TaxID=1459636 RepID=A0A075MPZ1_9ARCH|nr:6-carboxytetrahydropterin synthase [Candidatus Nitrososphaera evergladensis]AIF82932.1 6-pyruvoyl-tetrahydropterin synthase [Candidatus Nitrososphaera evergladensis SR1]
MPTERVVLNSDLRYLDSKGNLMRTRAELSVARMLDFLGHDYKYDQPVTLPDGKVVRVDFVAGSRHIEVVDSEADAAKFRRIKEEMQVLDIVAIGHSKYSSKVDEIDSMFFYDESERTQTGSIFIEDPSLAFDYAHILPLVEKCSVLHGHTSTVMVEIIGSMKNNLVVDFGEAKRIIKDTINMIDHKFFINKKYLEKEDDTHYYVSFQGPRGYFNLQLPKMTTWLMPGEATVENLSTEIIRLLAPRMPPNVEALGVYIYEGVNKGAHIIAGVKKEEKKG